MQLGRLDGWHVLIGAVLIALVALLVFELVKLLVGLLISALTGLLTLTLLVAIGYGAFLLIRGQRRDAG